MAIYCGLFVWSIINASFVQLRDKHKWIYCFLVLLPPVLFATIRYDIGTDYYSYSSFFYSENYFADLTYEPLFCLLNYVSNALFHDFFGVLLLSALITYSFVFAALLRLKDKASLELGLWIYYCYYYVASYNVMRQMIAVSIVLFATVMLFEKKPIKYLLLVIVAMLFHFSAILALVSLLFYSARLVNSKYMMYFIYASSLLLIFVGGSILEWVSSFGGGNYNQYLSNTNSIVSFSYLIDILPPALMIMLPIGLYYKFWRIDDRFDLFYIVGMFSLIVLILGFHYQWAMRSLYYFDIMQVLIWAINIKQIKSAKNRLKVSGIVVVFYLFYFWYSSVYHGSNGGVPYQSIWF